MRRRRVGRADARPWLSAAQPPARPSITLPVQVTLLLAVAFELLTLAIIRDNLTLNVIMLVAPSDAIRTWQAGA